MREIKFRAKIIDNGKWAYGFLYRHDPPLQCFAGEQKELPSFAILKTGFADWNMPRTIDQFEVDGKTVGQFTGLKDKTGKDVYEGDIIRADFGGIQNLQVMHSLNWDGRFDDTNAPFMSAWGATCGKYYYTFMNIYDPARYAEIIGNIYEHEELLK